MRRPLSNTCDYIPSQLALQIDDVCDRFEGAWQEASSSGLRPKVAEFIPPDSDQPLPFVRELLYIEITFRRSAGEYPRIEDYPELVRNYPTVVHELLGEDTPVTASKFQLELTSPRCRP